MLTKTRMSPSGQVSVLHLYYRPSPDTAAGRCDPGRTPLGLLEHGWPLHTTSVIQSTPGMRVTRSRVTASEFRTMLNRLEDTKNMNGVTWGLVLHLLRCPSQLLATV